MQCEKAFKARSHCTLNAHSIRFNAHSSRSYQKWIGPNRIQTVLLPIHFRRWFRSSSIQFKVDSHLRSRDICLYKELDPWLGSSPARNFPPSLSWGASPTALCASHVATFSTLVDEPAAFSILSKSTVPKSRSASSLSYSEIILLRARQFKSTSLGSILLKLPRLSTRGLLQDKKKIK